MKVKELILENLSDMIHDPWDEEEISFKAYLIMAILDKYPDTNVVITEDEKNSIIREVSKHFRT